MKKTLLATLVSAVVLSGTAMAGKFDFEPIESSAYGSYTDEDTFHQPWIIPEGFKQIRVKDESLLNVYSTENNAPTIAIKDENGDVVGYRYNDWHDMNTVNETGRQAGRFMYTTHEVRGNSIGGAVTVQDLHTGEVFNLAQDPSYDALDGIIWTPWKTLLFAEETTGGRLFEIKLNKDMVSGTVIDRPAVGRLAHEGIEIDKQGNVYVVDEFRGEQSGFGGGVYKFVPNRYGDLSSGDLYVLSTSEADGTGQGQWVGPIDPATARQSGTDAGGHGYNRPEDLEIIGDTLYVAVTEGPRNGTSDQQYDGRVLAVNLKTMMVTNFVVPGDAEGVTPEESSVATGFDNPDNLAKSPDGRLIIVEDNVPSDIWFATDENRDGVADKMELFASLKDNSAEGTGIYFSPLNRDVLYVNIQHSKFDNNDATWAIIKQHSSNHRDKNDYSEHKKRR